MQNTVIIYNTNKQLDIKALPVLGGCLLLSAAVCAAQILGNLAFLLLCLLVYLVFTIWACNKGVVFPVLLYFLEPTVQDVQRRNFVFYNCTSVMLHGFPFAK